MTAVTNAAIEMFVNKFEFLRDRIRAIPNLNKEWLDELSVLRLTSGAQTLTLPQNSIDCSSWNCLATVELE